MTCNFDKTTMLVDLGADSLVRKKNTDSLFCLWFPFVFFFIVPTLCSDFYFSFYLFFFFVFLLISFSLSSVFLCYLFRFCLLLFFPFSFSLSFLCSSVFCFSSVYCPLLNFFLDYLSTRISLF